MKLLLVAATSLASVLFASCSDEPSKAELACGAIEPALLEDVFGEKELDISGDLNPANDPVEVGKCVVHDGGDGTLSITAAQFKPDERPSLLEKLRKKQATSKQECPSPEIVEDWAVACTLDDGTVTIEAYTQEYSVGLSIRHDHKKVTIEQALEIAKSLDGKFPPLENPEYG